MTTQTAVRGYQKGYQQALRDIEAAYDRGDWVAVQEWLDNNIIRTEEERGGEPGYLAAGDGSAQNYYVDRQYRDLGGKE